METIRPCLWFDDNAEEAVNFYTSIFKNSNIGDVSRYGEEGPGMPGSVMVMSFELEGREFLALNGGPAYKFSEAISMSVDCKDQEEVDYFWSKLTAGGEQSMCGWLKDKFGLSWQIVPRRLIELLHDKDAERAGRVMEAMLKMNKIDVPTLERAAEGKVPA